MIRKLFILGLVLAVCLELSQGKPSPQAKAMEEFVNALIQVAALPALTSAAEQCRKVEDKGNNEETQWIMEDTSGNTRDFSVTNYNDAVRAIAQVTDAAIDSVTKSGDTVATYGTMRVDVQGRFTSGSRRFVNLQVQINRNRANANDRTTVATALIQTNPNGSLSGFMSIRYVRDALLRSLGDCKGRLSRVIRVKKSSSAVEMVV